MRVKEQESAEKGFNVSYKRYKIWVPECAELEEG